MPTENRSSNTELVSVPREPTREMLNGACMHPDLARSLWSALLKNVPQPAEQHQAEPDSYPPCDYCGVTPDHHPWHGSGLLEGVENRHIHACDGCRGKLPVHPGQYQGEPVAWRVAEGHSYRSYDFLCNARAAVAQWKSTFPDGEVEVEPLYTHADAGEVERLRQELRVARAQGRAEVVEMIICMSAEDGLDRFIGSHPIADTGDFGSHWEEEELRQHFKADPEAAGELELCRLSEYRSFHLEADVARLEGDLTQALSRQADQGVELATMTAELAERDALLREHSGKLIVLAARLIQEPLRALSRDLGSEKPITRIKVTDGVEQASDSLGGLAVEVRRVADALSASAEPNAHGNSQAPLDGSATPAESKS